MKIRKAVDVVQWRLCMGCGACAYACEKKKIVLEDVMGDGLRPAITCTECNQCSKCIEVCPGVKVNQDSRSDKKTFLTELRKRWGPILEVWEGHATDAEIRYLGSSGGAATAIGLYCLETKLAGGVLHIGKDEIEPWRNRPVISRTRQDLLSQTGSKYSPASVCDGLETIYSVSEPIVFLGKPCDVEGLRKTQLVKKELEGKIGLAVGIFCAGTPSTLGTLELLKTLKIELKIIEDIRYRGKGWPGKFSVKVKGENRVNQEMSYKDSWGFLQRYRPFRCYLCPDGTSEFADISCGDPWYREINENDAGYSLVLVRTERGRKILRGAMEAGYLILEPAPPDIIEKSQKGLLAKRRKIWGRLLALKMFGIPAPRYDGFSLYENWKELPLKEKARSILGTVRRIIQRKYYKPLDYQNVPAKKGCRGL